MKQWVKKWGISLLAVILAAIFPAIFLYASNSNEADFSEILLPLLVFAAVGIALFGVLFLLTRHAAKSAIIAILFLLLLENYAAVESAVKLVFPGLRYWQILPILLFLLLNIAIAIVKWMPNDLSGIISTVACVVFGVLIVVNIITAIPGEINKSNATKLEEEQQNLAAEQEEATGSNENNPNVYLLIFDEFAGFNQIQDYYGYENESLLQFLEDHDFTVSYDSHNECITTVTVTTNLVNLEYIVDDEVPASEKEILRKNGYLFTLMQEHGYTAQRIYEGNFFGESDVDFGGSQMDAATISGETLRELFLNKTAIYPFVVQEDATSYPAIEYLSNPDNIPREPTFILFYVVAPHQPFYYDEYGKLNPAREWNNWDDPKYYLGQYKYVSKRMEEMLENLVENDPDALIVAMSDHGARYAPGIKYEDASCIFNTFYFGGRNLDDYTGKSGVNTLRTLLNLALGTEFEELEMPG